MQPAQKSYGKNRSPNHMVSALSKREVILRRYFKMYVNLGKYESTQFHTFCVWAKGQSEYALLTELDR